MVYFKAILLLAAVAAASAAPPAAPATPEDTVRTKKDVLVASPYAALPLAYAYDDGSYYPGKYERTSYVSAAIQALPAAYAAYPYAYHAFPYRSIVI